MVFLVVVNPNVNGWKKGIKGLEVTKAVFSKGASPRAFFVPNRI